MAALRAREERNRTSSRASVSVERVLRHRGTPNVFSRRQRKQAFLPKVTAKRKRADLDSLHKEIVEVTNSNMTLGRVSARTMMTSTYDADVSREAAKLLFHDNYKGYQQRNITKSTERHLRDIQSNLEDNRFISEVFLDCIITGKAVTYFQLVEIVRSQNLIKDFNVLCDPKGCSLLSVAAAHNELPALLVLYGWTNVDVNSVNNTGYTALSIASFYGVWKAVDLLLRFGADMSIRNSNGESCLIVAANRLSFAAGENGFDDYTDIIRHFICLSPGNRDSIFVREYTENDHRQKIIRDPKARVIVHEWLKSRAQMKDLTPISFEIYSEDEAVVKYFFKKAKKTTRHWFAWLKIIILIGFIIYDVVFNGISGNILLYCGLYGLAYFI